jgi:hypothetical protein
MTPRFDWQAQEPSPDFAARTVAAHLRARARRPAVARRWIAVGGLAAVMVAGAAWGFTSLRGEARGSAVALAVEPPEAPVASVVEAPPVMAAELPDASLEAAAPPARPRHRVAAPAASAAPDAGRKVMLPRCDCEFDQVMCTCY